MAVIATGLVSELSIEGIKSVLNSINIIPGRMEKFDLPSKGLAIVDYAHSPDAYLQIFKMIKIIDQLRFFFVFLGITTFY